jgi:uracil-DNA glycosylase
MSIFLMEEEKQLEKLKQEAIGCYECSFGHSCTQKVFGEGPLGGSIMSISEAPGAEEDASGRPYMGKAGRFWEGMLRSVGMERSNLYICNALKCRPPNNKIEGLVELDACKHFLIKQVAIIQPRLILVFGKPAAYALGILAQADYGKPVKTRLGIQKEPYKYVGLDGVQRTARIMWTYHPSYLQNKPDGRNYCFQAYKQLCDAKKLLEADLPWDG